MIKALIGTARSVIGFAALVIILMGAGFGSSVAYSIQASESTGAILGAIGGLVVAGAVLGAVAAIVDMHRQVDVLLGLVREQNRTQAATLDALEKALARLDAAPLNPAPPPPPRIIRRDDGAGIAGHPVLGIGPR